ncbi:hypothetical protein ABPG74_019264, partial [Tetrahymena malaccensis]
IFIAYKNKKKGTQKQGYKRVGQGQIILVGGYRKKERRYCYQIFVGLKQLGKLQKKFDSTS